MSAWMLVEDEPDLYEVLKALFDAWGIEGLAFVEGEEATAWIDDVDHGAYTGELPELAMLDVRLPGAIKGPMVSRRLRTSPHLSNMAIVLSTAYKLTPQEEREVLAQSGADVLIYKPLPPFHELRAVFERVLAQRRAQVAARDQGGKPG